MTFQELLNDERREGREEGRIEGDKARLLRQIQAKLAKGKTVPVIAGELEEEVAIVEEAIRELQAES